jgi:UDP-N-acetylmuramate--alanine ligase
MVVRVGKWTHEGSSADKIAMMTAPSHSSSVRSQRALPGQHLHFVGIGGCGMSGLARLARQHGAWCTGSDLGRSSTVSALESDGFAISLVQSATSIPQDCDCLVVSAAIRDGHPELKEAQRRGITIIKYAQMLGQLMLGRTGVAIAGTHGKSTTTSLLSHVLIETGLDPSFIVGANCQQIGGGSRCGESDILVAEACEYDRSFHNLHPTHAVILNVEADHLDIYKSLDEIVEAFAVFARKLPSYGSLLINHEMSQRLTITAGLACSIETLGFSPQADWRVDVQDGRTRLHHKGEVVAQWTNPLPGDHMAYNAAAAAISAHRLGAAWEAIGAAVAGFLGLDRRMQRLGERAIAGGNVTVVDDYGHHPTEVDTTLRALRQHYRPERLICVFQPHQHSRTRFLMDEFAASFSEADVVIVPHIYFVRDSEKERHAVTAGDLVDRLRQKRVQAMHLYPFEAIVEQLELIARPGDLLVSMGAGDVWKVTHEFLAAG